MVDTLIALFESTDITFETNGLGGLSDAVSCTVTEERNGSFELEMTYPIDGLHYNDLKLRRIIFAKPNPYSDRQPFRIYEITRPINGIVTVMAEHISYDLSGYPVAPFSAENIGDAMRGLKINSVNQHPFTFSTDKDAVAKFKLDTPASIRSILGGTYGSILDVYDGGEYIFDGFKVELKNNRGSNNGVSIRYGKNLTDLKQEENCSSVYTGVYPFWYSEEDGLHQLKDKIVNTKGTYDFTRILPLDLTGEFEIAPTEDQLRSYAEKYISNNNIGVPKVSLDVSFVQLSDSEEYSDLVLLEKVQLCDIVNVEFPELNVSATAKCIKTNYNVLTNKYKSISLGDSRTNLADTISYQSQTIEKQESTFQTEIERATELITGGLGGFVIMHSSSGSKKPDEILIMDTDDINTATKVWRWNKNGWGYSRNGYNGPYALAATMDGSIVADFITTGTLKADLLTTGGSLGGWKIDNVSIKNVIDANNYVLLKSNDENEFIHAVSSKKVSYLSQIWDELIDFKIGLNNGLSYSYRMKTSDQELVSYVQRLGGRNGCNLYGTFNGAITGDINGIHPRLTTNGGLDYVYESGSKSIVRKLITDLGGTVEYLTSNGNVNLGTKGALYLNNSIVTRVGSTSSNYTGWAELVCGPGSGGNASVDYNGTYKPMTASSHPIGSSRRFKENIFPITDTRIDDILKIDIITYDYKENIVDEDERFDRSGVIAEDVVDIIPESVTYGYEEGEKIIFGVDYSRYVPYLIALCQRQQKEIDELREMLERR